MCLVTWGKHPSHGDVWLKLCGRSSLRYRVKRRCDGWQVAVLVEGQHPDATIDYMVIHAAMARKPDLPSPASAACPKAK